jgi:hypothetical protein
MSVISSCPIWRQRALMPTPAVTAMATHSGKCNRIRRYVKKNTPRTARFMRISAGSAVSPKSFSRPARMKGKPG